MQPHLICQSLSIWRMTGCA
uniref:Uncharacterized protein n=1 Tax=Anguilla anguilla TaxID=7936 RepID=A0A0E9VSV2_ANGAN